MESYDACEWPMVVLACETGATLGSNRFALFFASVLQVARPLSIINQFALPAKAAPGWTYAHSTAQFEAAQSQPQKTKEQ